MGEFFTPSVQAEFTHILAALDPALRLLGYSDREMFSICLALEGAFVYAIRYGNRTDPDKRVHVVFRASADRFDACVTDEGPGHSPSDPDLISDEWVEELQARGRLVLESGLRVSFRGRGNVTVLTRLRHATL